MRYPEKKMLLPDEQHRIVIWQTDLSVLCMVQATFDGQTKQEFRIDKRNPQWNDLVHQFCELARQKYPRPLRHKNSYHRQRFGL